MTKPEINERLDQRPFRPFKVRVAGDGEYGVPSGGTAFIDVPLITSIHVKETV